MHEQDALVWEGEQVVTVRRVPSPSGLGATDKLNVRALISKIFPLQDAVTALDSLRRGEQMKVLIKPER